MLQQILITLFGDVGRILRWTSPSVHMWNTSTHSNICVKHEGQTEAVNITKEIEKRTSLQVKDDEKLLIYLHVPTGTCQTVVRCNYPAGARKCVMRKIYCIWWTQRCCKRKNTKTSVPHWATHNLSDRHSYWRECCVVINYGISHAFGISPLDRRTGNQSVHIHYITWLL